MSQLPAAVCQLHCEAVLDKVALRSFLSLKIDVNPFCKQSLNYLMRVQLSPVLHVVVIEKVLDHVEGVIEGGVVRMILGSVLDQIL